MSVTAHMHAVLSDDTRVVVLDDRGWGGTLGWIGEPPDPPVDPWSLETEEGIEREALVVVGPDEPFDDSVTFDDMDRDYWQFVAEHLAERGIAADPAALRELPHDVELTDRLRARIAAAPPPPA